MSPAGAGVAAAWLRLGGNPRLSEKMGEERRKRKCPSKTALTQMGLGNCLVTLDWTQKRAK